MNPQFLIEWEKFCASSEGQTFDSKDRLNQDLAHRFFCLGFANGRYSSPATADSAPEPYTQEFSPPIEEPPPGS